MKERQPWTLSLKISDPSPCPTLLDQILDSPVIGCTYLHTPKSPNFCILFHFDIADHMTN